MKISDMIRFCFSNLLRRKLRTFLTISGIVLGTCSIVLTLAFSYTTTKNIEDAMKNGDNINTITVIQQDYSQTNFNKKPKNINSGRQQHEEKNYNLDYGPNLVNKLSKIDGVNFVFPVKQVGNWESFAYNVGKKYLTIRPITGINLDNKEHLKKMGYEFLNDITFAKSSTSKKKNAVMGPLFGYDFYNIAGSSKDWKTIYRNWYAADDPFFDLSKEKICMTVLSPKGIKQLQKMWDNIYSNSKSYGEDDDDDTSTTASSINADEMLGKKYELNIEGILSYKGQNYLKIDKDKSTILQDLDWKTRSKLNGVYVDLDTALELEKECNKYKDANSNSDNTKAKGNKVFYDDIYVVAKDWNDVEPIINEIQNKLNYKTSSLLGDIKEKQKQTAGIRVMLGALGIITVIVSALGIANMMFMSISERTREIGIMKVLGCKLRNIKLMFLTEAGAVGLLGGVVGVGGSYGISKGISALVKHVSTEEFAKKVVDNQMLKKVLETINEFAAMFNAQADRDMIIIPMYLIIGGVLFGTLVGLISGLSPANKAVKISALSAIKQD